MSILFVISAPSGSGKSTLVSRAMESDPRLAFSVSYTTRGRRGAERPGQHYHYISREEFEARISRGEFLEYAEVFGNYYGTHVSTLEDARARGCDLILDIDVQGARKLKGRVPDAVTIFILPPSQAVLEQRLRHRSEDAEEVIRRRLRDAAEEIRSCGDYDYVIVNRDLEESAADLLAIFRAERCRLRRRRDDITPILGSFA